MTEVTSGEQELTDQPSCGWHLSGRRWTEKTSGPANNGRAGSPCSAGVSGVRPPDGQGWVRSVATAGPTVAGSGGAPLPLAGPAEREAPAAREATTRCWQRSRHQKSRRVLHLKGEADRKQPAQFRKLQGKSGSSQSGNGAPGLPRRFDQSGRALRNAVNRSLGRPPSGRLSVPAQGVRRARPAPSCFSSN